MARMTPETNTSELRGFIPRFYHKTLPEEILRLNFSETIANCSKCPMAGSGVEIYRPDLKCCTYYPLVLNYHVGELLSQGEQHQTEMVAEMIRSRQYALPLGLCPPPAYQLQFSFKKAIDFGQEPGLLCPFFSKGKCQIWEFRSSECVSFICESSYGERGRGFWGSLGEYLFAVEMTLAQNVMIEFGFDDVALDEQLNVAKLKHFETEDEVHWQLTDTKWREHWKHWSEDAFGFYLSCAERTREKGTQWIQQNPRLRKLMDQTIQAHRAMVSKDS